ncbi:MAG: hypothetical protein ACM3TR_08950 [Caulobacteraceae bacterium]
MKNAKYVGTLFIVFIACFSIWTFADGIRKVVQGEEIDAKVIYNGNEVILGQKPISVNGYNYLSISALSNLFGKDMEWNQKENKISIKDRINPAEQSLKEQLAAKDKSIAEMQQKIANLEQELSLKKVLTLEGLESKINSEMAMYKDLPYKVMLSGNQDEIRLKVILDLSADSSEWYGLSSYEKMELLKNVSDVITGEYPNAKIKGFIKDISKGNKLMSFYSTPKGDIKTGYYKSYNPISTIEDKFNDEYAKYFSGICMIYNINGSENKVDFSVGISHYKYGEEWDKITDYRVKSFMSKLSGDIRAQFRECEINGIIYDTDTKEELASSQISPGKSFDFTRNR